MDDEQVIVDGAIHPLNGQYLTWPASRVRLTSFTFMKGVQLNIPYTCASNVTLHDYSNACEFINYQFHIRRLRFKGCSLKDHDLLDFIVPSERFMHLEFVRCNVDLPTLTRFVKDCGPMETIRLQRCDFGHVANKTREDLNTFLQMVFRRSTSLHEVRVKQYFRVDWFSIDYQFSIDRLKFSGCYLDGHDILDYVVPSARYLNLEFHNCDVNLPSLTNFVRGCGNVNTIHLMNCKFGTFSAQQDIDIKSFLSTSLQCTSLVDLRIRPGHIIRFSHCGLIAGMAQNLRRLDLTSIKYGFSERHWRNLEPALVAGASALTDVLFNVTFLCRHEGETGWDGFHNAITDSRRDRSPLERIIHSNHAVCNIGCAVQSCGPRKSVGTGTCAFHFFPEITVDVQMPSDMVFSLLTNQRTSHMYYGERLKVMTYLEFYEFVQARIDEVNHCEDSFLSGKYWYHLCHLLAWTGTPRHELHLDYVHPLHHARQHNGAIVGSLNWLYYVLQNVISWKQGCTMVLPSSP